VDGVLTDGSLIFGATGEFKIFSVKDGLGLQLAQKAGLGIGLLSSRSSEMVAHRAKELGIDEVMLGTRDKEKAFEDFLSRRGVASQEVAYIGDDLPDLPVLLRCGLAAAPADAVAEVRKRVHYITQAKGGRGAVRELVERILESQGKLKEILRPYLPSTKD
jgi:3-deoxy-D-manno-octulosonate 8-phosphate phosphatase (KDO 8-P phosphatase)